MADKDYEPYSSFRDRSLASAQYEKAVYLNEVAADKVLRLLPVGQEKQAEIAVG